MRISPKRGNPTPPLDNLLVHRIANKLDGVDLVRWAAVCKQHRQVVEPRLALVTGMTQGMTHWGPQPMFNRYEKPESYATLGYLYGAVLAFEPLGNTGVALVGAAGGLLGAVLDLPLYPLRTWLAHRRADRQAANDRAQWRARREVYYRGQLRAF